MDIVSFKISLSTRSSNDWRSGKSPLICICDYLFVGGHTVEALVDRIISRITHATTQTKRYHLIIINKSRCYEVLWHDAGNSSIQMAMVCAPKEKSTRTTIVNWFLTCYVEIRNIRAWPHAINHNMRLHITPRRSHYTENTLVASNSFSFIFVSFHSTFFVLFCLLSRYRFLSLHYVINMYKCDDSLETYSICCFVFQMGLNRTNEKKVKKRETNAKNDVHR